MNFERSSEKQIHQIATSALPAFGLEGGVLTAIQHLVNSSLLIFWAAAQSPQHPWIEDQWERLRVYLSMG